MTTGAIETGSLHTAVVGFAHGWWTIQVAGSSTRVRRLGEADVAARALLGAELGLPADAVRVRLVPDIVRSPMAPRRRSWSRRG